MSEEKTKGIVSDKLKNLKNYPEEQDTMNNGIIWFKEDSYKSLKEYNWITETLKTASKNHLIMRIVLNLDLQDYSLICNCSII